MLLKQIKLFFRKIRDYFVFQYQLYFSIVSIFPINSELSRAQALGLISLINTIYIAGISLFIYSNFSVTKISLNFVQIFIIVLLIITTTRYILGDFYYVENFKHFSSKQYLVFLIVIIISLVFSAFLINAGKNNLKKNRLHLIATSIETP